MGLVKGQFHSVMEGPGLLHLSGYGIHCRLREAHLEIRVHDLDASSEARRVTQKRIMDRG